MTRSARLRLVLGLVLVVVAAGALTLHLNATKGVVASTSAHVAAQTYDVGAAWAGLVVSQPAVVGASVHKGDPLFVIQSAELRRDVAAGLLDPTRAATVVDADGNLVVTATADGVVTAVDATLGTFVTAGSRLATVDRAGSLTVRADLTVTPEQLARIERGARVDLVLPDGNRLEGTAGEMTVRTVERDARVQLTVHSRGLVRGAEGGLVVPGTPVTAQVHLRNDGVVTTVADWLHHTWSGLVR